MRLACKAPSCPQEVKAATLHFFLLNHLGLKDGVPRIEQVSLRSTGCHQEVLVPLMHCIQSSAQ